MSIVAQKQPAATVAAVETPFRRFASSFADSNMAMLALGMLLVIVFIAVFAPLISPQDPYDLAVVSIMDSRLEPGEQMVPAMTHCLSAGAMPGS